MLIQLSSLIIDDNRCQSDALFSLLLWNWKEIMPLAASKLRDPRIPRTRQLLQEALQTLLRSRKFEDISVQDITEAATVNRATFYDHYTDKFALLDALAAGGFHKLLHERGVRYDAGCPTAASAIIRATCDYLAQMRAEHKACTERSATGLLVDAAIIAAIHRVLTANQPLPELAASAAS